MQTMQKHKHIYESHKNGERNAHKWVNIELDPKGQTIDDAAPDRATTTASESSPSESTELLDIWINDGFPN